MNLLIKTTRIVIALTIFSLITVSCQEEKLEPGKASVKVSGSQNAIIPYNFDWEDPNLNWMPYPANQPKITVPWTGPGSLFGVIADDVLADRKKSDGWRLVYSTFDPNVWNKNPYFMLYNKYRGLVRIYLYVNDIQFSESSYLQDGLYLGNTSFKLLNFADKEIVDPTVNMSRVDRVEPKPFNGAPLANNKWYFLQYELAYDPSIVPTTSSTPPQISFYVNSVNVQQISLGGTIEGTIKGTIGASQTSANQNIWNAVTPGLKTLGTAGLSAIGVGAMNNNTINNDAGTNTLGVNSAIWKAAKKGIEAALSTATGNIPGAVVNVLSAIIGGSSSSGGQTANLTLNGSLKVDGSQTGTGSLPSTPVSMYLPGSVQANSNGTYNVQGYVPLYNESLGVFNLASKPTVKIHLKRTPDWQTPGMNMYDVEYSVVPGTLNFQWNPVVNGRDATIVGLTSKVIATHFAGNIETGMVYMTGSRETIMGNTAFTGTTFRTIHRYDYAPPEASTVLVRVSFVVRPNDGSPDVAIVKTFTANVERTYQW